MRNLLRNYKDFYKVNENEEDKPFRLYGEGSTPEAQLIDLLKSLIEYIKKADPRDQESYDLIKKDISDRKNDITNHPSFSDFKHGFNWQDSVIKLSDWNVDLKKAISSLYSKAEKRELF